MYFEFDFLIYRNETGHSCESVSNAKVIYNGPLTVCLIHCNFKLASFVSE